VVHDRAVEPGQTVTAGFTTPILFTLSEDLSRLSLRVDVDEADVGHVREQMPATFTVDAFPGETFASTVLSVHWQPKTTSGVVSYEAELLVDNRKRLLRPGMTATATVLSETHAGALLVPDAALRFTPPTTGARPGPPGAAATPAEARPGVRSVWVLESGKPSQREVTTGLDDGHQSEVLSGTLAAGDAVLTGLQEAP
jgi:HlyD family secretion protein